MGAFEEGGVAGVCVERKYDRKEEIRRIVG